VPRGSFHLQGGALTALHRYVFDRLGRGVALLDAAGTVVDASALAQKAFTGGPGISLRNGRLAFADAELDARFARLLGSGRGGGDGKSLAAAVRNNGAMPCRLVVVPTSAQVARQGVKFVALVYASEGSRSISPDLLVDLYGLTRAQANVARRLYAGSSVEETAAQLKLSPNTVRTHLKQIFSKCEVQSQAELLLLLATGPQSL
jgi:DNA-binding CsgD family transcriptional regulator